MEDPDAPRGAFTHWILFNLPASERQLAEGVPTVARLPKGALQGENSGGSIGYSGPCPPPGPVHHYKFSLHALDRTLDARPGASKEVIRQAMKGHILARGELIGTYRR